jgi:hypothetical protein
MAVKCKAVSSHSGSGKMNYLCEKEYLARILHKMSGKQYQTKEPSGRSDR